MAELTNELVIEIVKKRFGEDILNVETPYNLLSFTVRKEKILEIIRFLYEEQELQFQFLTDLTGIHFPEPHDELGVIYHLHNLPKNKRIRIKSFMPKKNPKIDSITPVFKGANWMERETYDFFGVLFQGHPNLKRILNVEDMEYFPLRKEYALEDATRTDKDDSMFGR